MRTTVCIGLAGALASFGALAEDEHRELDAHEHGHGALNIAVEGSRMVMELEVPGADIVGFEHVAESAEDKAKIEAARAVLAKPLDLFVLPAAAGCAVETAEVSLIGDEHDDHDEHADEHDDHDEHADDHEDEHADEHADEHEDEHAEEHEDEHGDEHADEHADEHEEEDGAVHSEFFAAYELVCDDAAAVTDITFAYFDAFPGAEELEVGVITDAGQAAFEVERDSPAITIAR